MYICSSVGYSCCAVYNLSWFYHQLSQSTQDDVEVRICTDQSYNDEAILVASLELYVQ